MKPVLSTKKSVKSQAWQREQQPARLPALTTYSFGSFVAKSFIKHQTVSPMMNPQLVTKKIHPPTLKPVAIALLLFV